MRYSSHLYLRTDGQLGRYPIIEVAPDGRIVSVSEHEEFGQEIARTKFFSGVIIPETEAFSFGSREEFICKCKKHIGDAFIEVGKYTKLMVVCNFDLNSFDGKGAKFSHLSHL